MLRRALGLCTGRRFWRSLSVSFTRWGSEDTSAPLFALTPCSDPLNLYPTHTWSIWFPLTWSGGRHVLLWMFLCGKMLWPMTLLFRTQKRAAGSPFLSIAPRPCLPIICWYALLSAPIFVLKSPVSIFRPFCLCLSSAFCILLWKFSYLFCCVHYLWWCRPSYCILVLSLAVVILELTASQPVSARCASSISIRATPSVSGVSSSLKHDYVHLVSHGRSMDTLQLFISVVTWLPSLLNRMCSWPGWRSWWSSLMPKGSGVGFGLAASISFSIQRVILHLREGSSTPKSESFAFRRCCCDWLGLRIASPIRIPEPPAEVA